MARTESSMAPLGMQAPDFTLTDTVSDKLLSLSDVKSDMATVIMFICNHCPYVVHVQDGIVELANDYIPRGVAFVGISANDVIGYPEDAPELMKEIAIEHAYEFPYLYDETQAVARAYSAECTPDFFVFDASMKLAYRGQMDGSRPGNGIPVTGEDIRAALDAMLAGQQPKKEQRPSLGCNIKWKAQD